MASITVAGVGSGLDINSLVDQLVAAERKPVADRLDRREVREQARLSAYGTLKGALASLQTAASRLASLTTFESKTVSVSNTERLTASASSIAVAGNYSVEVTALAQNHALATPSGAFASQDDVVGTGTLTFGFGTTVYNADTDTYTSFTPDSGTASQQVVITDGTLSGIRDAVNEANIGVKASIVDDGAGYRLLFVSEDSGATASLEVSVAEDGATPTNTDNNGLSRLAFSAAATNLEQTTAAQDAALKVDGLALTRASNTVTGAIAGVTLNLRTAAVGQPVTVTVSNDGQGVIDAVDGFVAAYNDVSGSVYNLSRFDPDTGEAGLLIGDATVRGIAADIRRVLGESIPGIYGAYDSLVAVGITTEVRARTLDDGTEILPGSLSFDSTKLAQALSEAPDTVARLFAGDDGADAGATTGIADRMSTALTRLLGSGGTIESNTQGAQTAIDRIDDERLALDKRMTSLEARLRAQFTALDGLLSQLRSTGDYLTQQLSTLSGSR